MAKPDENEVTEISDSDSNEVIEIHDDSDNDDDPYIAAEPENEIEWVEESSESEDEIECEIWDDDCVTIHNQQPRKNAISGYHLIPSCLQEHEIHQVKRQKLIEIPLLNESLKKSDFIQSFKENWNANTNYKMSPIDLQTDPFKFCIIDDFVVDTIILDEIRKEMNELEWNKRNMDLYEFFQSEDLTQIKQKYINHIYEFLKTDIKDWLQQITGQEFYKISSTCSAYSDTDYLLIHDDLQEDRSIAFILYLTDPVPGSDQELWTSEMGGLLELFNKDEKGHPSIPVRQIIPKNNRFVFFKVTNDSYHQVSEVLNMDHCRLSINGWFHSLKLEKYEAPILEPPKTGLFGSERLSPLISDFPLNNWINHQYLKNDIKKQIQHHVENESEISLNDFFNEDKFQELCEVLKNDDIIWRNVGPPNRRNYEVISNSVAPNIVTEILTLFQSKNMFNLLNEFTDLDLNIDAKPTIKPTLRLELQRWKPGSYALFSEYEWEKVYELDLIMYLGNSESLNVVGGQTMYVSISEKIEDAFVTLQPKTNSLNIVFRDTARIVKYVSKRSCNEYFYMIVCSYTE